MYTGYDYNNELYHHGIKGQKWGVRRFQNQDGSYTNTGMKRYGYDGSRDGGTRSFKGNMHRALAKANEINSNYWGKNNRNSTLASMQRAERDRQLKLAEQADSMKAKRAVKANTWDKLSDKQKKAVKVGAAVAGTAIAAYATYKIAGPKIAAYRNDKAIQASVSRSRTLLQTGNQNSRNYAKKTIFQANSGTRKAAVDRHLNKEFRSVNNVYGVDLVKPVNVAKPSSSRNFSSGSRTNFRVSGRASTNSAMSRRGINRTYTAKVRSDNAKVKQMTAELMKDHNWDSKTAENYAWWQLRNRGAYFGK